MTVPTLVLQGSVDTLFDLTDGYGVYEHVRAQGVDARFVAFCGGHVACPASYVDAGDRGHLDDAIVAWFARHLLGQDVDTGAPVEYRTNVGDVASTRPRSRRRASGGFPSPARRPQLAVVPIIDVPDVDATSPGSRARFSGIPGAAHHHLAGRPPTATRAAATFEVARAGEGGARRGRLPARSQLTVTGTTAPLDAVLGPVGDAIGGLDAFEQIGDVLVGDLGPIEGVLDGLGGLSGIGGLATRWRTSSSSSSTARPARC